MWHCASLCLLLIIAVWMIAYGLMKHGNNRIEVNIISKNSVTNTSGKIDGVVETRGKIRHHVPKFMLDLYEQSKNLRKNSFNRSVPDVVRSVVPTHAETLYPGLLQDEVNNDHHVLVFNVPQTNTDEIFLEADLRVLTLVQVSSNTVMGIERIIKVSFYNDTTRQLTTLEEKHVYQIDNSWISFNVSNAVQYLLNGKKSTKMTLKLILTIKSFLPIIDNKIGLFKLSLMPIVEDFEHEYPVLLLFYKSIKADLQKKVVAKTLFHNLEGNISRVRMKRFIEEDYEEESNRVWDDDGMGKPWTKKMKRMRNACRKRPLYINFAEIQYDTWIVQPTGYEAYQCSGKCFYPVAEHLSPTKHAIVQALLHSVAPSRAPRSCCVPTKLDSISVLYVDNQGVLTYRYGYKDMVVTECGCR